MGVGDIREMEVQVRQKGGVHPEDRKGLSPVQHPTPLRAHSLPSPHPPP